MNTCPKCGTDVTDKAVCPSCGTIVQAGNTGAQLLAQPAIISGIQIPFLSLVGFMIKFSIAAIPAAIIISVLYAFISFVIFGIVI